MPKIIKLDKQLANQIAAGEVVERPVSVVKELVENSIDAKSTHIKVEIKNGGIKEIIVNDNGEGIEKEDLKIVLQKYTTSKIKNITDLYNIMTFGFRGEALSSISSVSKFKIISNGYFLETTEEKDNFGEIASEKGTKIIVKDLFYNTPARLNYLKKPRTEYSKIKEFLEYISLSYPKIGFEFISDSKQIFLYRDGENLKNRIYNIYGDNFASNLLKIDYEFVGFKILGYISDPKISFTNKNKQVIFVNNRIIKSPLIMKAISDAYNRFIPHSSYPGYILNIQVDPTQVDVNVHPRKLEIRFAQESQIFRGFYHAIEDKLNSISLIDSSGLIDFKNQEVTQIKQEKYYTGSGTKFKSYSPYKNTNPNPNQYKINDSIQFTKNIIENNESEFNNSMESTDLSNTPIGKIIGQLHNSYIIVQTKNGLKILDQHALAERIIYEKLLKNSQEKKSNTQGLLIGESIKLISKELNILKDNKSVFYEMGFDFEFLNNGIILINAIPDFIKKENIGDIFTGIINDIGEYNFNKSKTLQEVKNKIFAYTACRSAIKFGHKLNIFEMNKLLSDSIIDYSSTCPHGRPVVYDIDLNELKNKYER